MTLVLLLVLGVAYWLQGVALQPVRPAWEPCPVPQWRTHSAYGWGPWHCPAWEKKP